MYLEVRKTKYQKEKKMKNIIDKKLKEVQQDQEIACDDFDAMINRMDMKHNNGAAMTDKDVDMLFGQMAEMAGNNIAIKDLRNVKEENKTGLNTEEFKELTSDKTDDMEVDEITKKRIEKNTGYKFLNDKELEKAVKGGYIEFTESNVIDGVDETFNKKEYDKYNDIEKTNREIMRETAKRLHI